MADTLERSPSTVISLPRLSPRHITLVFVALAAALIGQLLAVHVVSLGADAPALVDSTPYKLAIWIADQNQKEVPVSVLASAARVWAQMRGQPAASAEELVLLAQQSVAIWCALAGVVTLAGAGGLIARALWARRPLLAGLAMYASLLFVFPSVPESGLGPALLAVVLLVIVLVFGQLDVRRAGSFAVVICTVLAGWELAKAAADSIDYGIRVAQPSWSYTTFADLDAGLAALQQGEIAAFFADRKALESLMPGIGDRYALPDAAYPDLRWVGLSSDEQVFIFPVQPTLPGRVAAAVPAARAASLGSPSQLIGSTVGAVEADFAVERYLALPRTLTLLDLKILNDLNLPHLQAIAEAFLQPARRNGEMLLVRILGQAGLYTWGEAVFGFVFGALLGLVLGTVFAHSRLMERAFLPYVVASQTVPILAIAPMVVIWLGASPTSVAVIAVYITFFPVTINTLRGLQSPDPLALELMESYAASRWKTLWKLRFPAALPYIFAALKVSATSSVVGAIIGELPSGIGAGLGRAILDFSSDYSLVSTPKLWAAIITAAAVGMTFFLLVSLAERFVLRKYVRAAGG
jgi:NitT/TauT family transport system permease protein